MLKHVKVVNQNKFLHENWTIPFNSQSFNKVNSRKLNVDNIYLVTFFKNEILFHHCQTFFLALEINLWKCGLSFNQLYIVARDCKKNLVLLHQQNLLVHYNLWLFWFMCLITLNWIFLLPGPNMSYLLAIHQSDGWPDAQLLCSKC